METRVKIPVVPSLVKMILQVELNSFFRCLHLNRDLIIGFIGDRGSGKSLGGGTIALFDYMIQCVHDSKGNYLGTEPCWSNMSIAADITLDNETAEKYREVGIKTSGGVAHYQSRELDIQRWLEADPEYQRGCAFIDEINVAVADARRSMSNQNLAASDAGQMQRKTDSTLIYTSISEMFVEQRIRDMTDIFIKTSDTALSVNGMIKKQKQGEMFKWTIYPMTAKGAAILKTATYAVSQQAIEGWTLRGRPVWGLISTLERQERTKYKMSATKNDQTIIDAQEISFKEDPKVVEVKNKFYWLPERVIELREGPVKKRYTSAELDELLQITAHGQTMSTAGKILPAYGIRNTGTRVRQNYGGGFYWAVDEAVTIEDMLEKAHPRATAAAVLV